MTEQAATTEYIEMDRSEWRYALIRSITRAAGCNVAIETIDVGKQSRYAFYGDPSAIATAVELYKYIAHERNNVSPKPDHSHESNMFRSKMVAMLSHSFDKLAGI